MWSLGSRADRATGRSKHQSSSGMTPRAGCGSVAHGGRRRPGHRGGLGSGGAVILLQRAVPPSSARSPLLRPFPQASRLLGRGRRGHRRWRRRTARRQQGRRAEPAPIAATVARTMDAPAAPAPPTAASDAASSANHRAPCIRAPPNEVEVQRTAGRLHGFPDEVDARHQSTAAVRVSSTRGATTHGAVACGRRVERAALPLSPSRVIRLRPDQINRHGRMPSGLRCRDSAQAKRTPRTTRSVHTACTRSRSRPIVGIDPTTGFPERRGRRSARPSGDVTVWPGPTDWLTKSVTLWPWPCGWRSPQRPRQHPAIELRQASGATHYRQQRTGRNHLAIGRMQAQQGRCACSPPCSATIGWKSDPAGPAGRHRPAAQGRADCPCSGAAGADGGGTGTAGQRRRLHPRCVLGGIEDRRSVGVGRAQIRGTDDQIEPDIFPRRFEGMLANGLAQLLARRHAVARCRRRHRRSGSTITVAAGHGTDPSCATMNCATSSAALGRGQPQPLTQDGYVFHARTSPRRDAATAHLDQRLLARPAWRRGSADRCLSNGSAGHLRRAPADRARPPHAVGHRRDQVPGRIGLTGNHRRRR